MSEIARDSAPEGIEHEQLVRSLQCRGCGYDLKGLVLGGRCPECGEDVWSTVVVVVDPAASRLPKVRRPSVVGGALVSTVSLMTLAVVAGGVFLGCAVFGVDMSWWNGPIVGLPGGALLLAAAAVTPLAPPVAARADRAVRFAVYRLSGLLVVAGIALALFGSDWGKPRFQWAQTTGSTQGSGLEASVGFILLSGVTAAALIAALFPLRHIVLVVGERSRMFRTARGGRQRIRDLMIAIAALAVGEGVYLLASLDFDPGVAGRVGIVIMLVSMLMLVIGFVYLTVNMVWIFRALHQPPPTLRELLTVPDEPADYDAGHEYSHDESADDEVHDGV